MPLSIGTRLGSYEVGVLMGVGGHTERRPSEADARYQCEFALGVGPQRQ